MFFVPLYFGLLRVGIVGIEPTKCPSCKDGGLNLLAYIPIILFLTNICFLDEIRKHHV